MIGVLPAGFRFPDESEIWVPRELWERIPSRTAHNWHVIGRLRDGISPAQAHAELSVIARQIKQQFGQDVDMTDVAVARLAGRNDRRRARGFVDSDGSGGISPVDCVRQRREPAAGTGFDQRAGVGDSRRHWSRQGATGAAVSD